MNKDLSAIILGVSSFFVTAIVCIGLAFFHANFVSSVGEENLKLTKENIDLESQLIKERGNVMKLEAELYRVFSQLRELEYSISDKKSLKPRTTNESKN
jgi:hypothetical protein